MAARALHVGAAQAERLQGLRLHRRNAQNVRVEVEAAKNRAAEAVDDAKAAAWAVAVAVRADVDAAVAELKAIRENVMQMSCAACVSQSLRRTFSCRVGTHVYARIASRIF